MPNTPTLTQVERLEMLIDQLWEQGQELAIRIETATECAWWGELRYTRDPNREDGRPDRSDVLFAAGCANPDHVIERLLDEFEASVL